MPATTPASTGEPAVRVDGLTKRYRRVEAVRGLDLVAPRGRITALLGPNGAGKTTTVECCEGLRRPDTGTVRVLGLDPVRDAPALRPRVGVMLQDGGLPSTVPALEALRHVSRMYARPRDVSELAERLGLGSFARTPVRRLSGGQRQRLALATAVVGRPTVVFLDEPSAGLDPQARLAVWQLVRDLRADGVSVVVTTHQMAEAEALADHVVVVDHGQAIASGTVDSLVGGDGSMHVSVQPLAPHRAEPADAELARHLTDALGRSGHEHSVTTSSLAGTLEVHGPPGPELVHAVTGWARDQELLITSLTTGRRTLEDVFLDLTGRSLR
ncbi:ABC transporter ATP-binding protein [Actinotalea soli]|uniref:ABC transporter ATP-binding protein n=1 Tax=Actinotalea soli TaxID=2819234 RepID=UPI0027DE5206|nr:ABC transporter ATP-binding protein [Actinotalea soli]